MKALVFILFLLTPCLAKAGHWEWHHAERVWVNDDGSWHYKNDKLVGAWKDYIERERARDHIEIGSLITENGVRVSCVYLVRCGQDTEVHLIFPDGRDIEVTVQVGTPTSTMDKELQEIADQQ